jgi:ABC-2 type transport system ATP-binding protein
VFVSSHLMSEMALTAEHVVVVGRGRVLADVPMDQLIAGASSGVVIVRTPGAAQLAGALVAKGVTIRQRDGDVLEVTGLAAGEIGQIALDERIVLHGLAPQEASLEEAFMEMTRDSIDFHAHVESVA